ncbi:MAG: amidohydrolase [Desulfobacterales bacterium]|nr:MAG: amidohydrolase [Desulfobacterales bacterium]
MDKIFVNGAVHTLDDAGRVYEALGITGERISALGARSEIQSQAGRRTEVVDLKGAVLFPGLIDSHTHLMIYAYLLDGLDLAPPKVKKIDDVVAQVKAAVGRAAPGQWIRGSRFAEYWLAENRYPTRFDLDRVAPHNPVILYHTSFHACVLNSPALKELGLTRASACPVGGIIEKDGGTGELTGILHDAAMMDLAFRHLFVRDLAAMNTAARVAMCSQAMARFAEVGVVAVSDALVTPASLTVYQETLAAGQAKVRVNMMPELSVSENLMATGICSGFGNEWLKIGPIKIFEDGGMSNRTAAVSTPYLTPPHGRGLKVLPREEMMAAVARVHALGFQISVHCQGDDGLTDTLDAFEAVLGPRADNARRHRIEHAGCLYPHLLERAAAMQIAVSSQPVMFSELGDGWIEAFGRETADKLYPFKSMLRAGIALGGSSDCPVDPHDPRLGLRDAVLRRTAAGEILGPQEALTMGEALRMFTRGSAYVNCDDRIAGTLARGKRADFTVLAADPRQVPAAEVVDIPVVMTVVGGELTYTS